MYVINTNYCFLFILVANTFLTTSKFKTERNINQIKSIALEISNLYTATFGTIDGRKISMISHEDETIGMIEC